MKPKNDKTRKIWLAGLKKGDPIGVLLPYGEVVVNTVSAVYWHDGKLDGFFVNEHYTATGKAGDKWLVPLTEAQRAEWEREKRIREAIDELNCVRWVFLAKDQILAVAEVLWPGRYSSVK